MRLHQHLYSLKMDKFSYHYRLNSLQDFRDRLYCLNQYCVNNDKLKCFPLTFRSIHTEEHVLNHCRSKGRGFGSSKTKPHPQYSTDWSKAVLLLWFLNHVIYYYVRVYMVSSNMITSIIVAHSAFCFVL